jgi:hypothetical protein
MANGDDINKELDATEETIEAQKAKLVVQEKLLEIRKKLNSEEKTATEYAQDQADIDLKRLRTVEDELAKEILLNQEKIEGGKLDADGLKTAKDAVIAAESALFLATKEADAKERANRAAEATIKHADNLFKRMTPFLSDVPETAAGAFFLNPGKFAGQFAAKMGDLVNPTKLATGLIDTMAQATYALAIEQDAAIASFRQATGASGEFDQTIIDLERDLVTAGVTSGEAGQAVQSLFLNVTDFTEMLPAQRDELSRTVSLLNELGVSTESTSKNIQFGTKVLGMSVKQAGALQRELATFAKDLGVSSQQIADDFTAMGPQIAALGSNGVDAFRKLQVQAKATGLQMSELLGIVEKFDKFDTAAQSVGKLNALLGGPYLNTLELVAETDPSKRFEILKNSVDQAGLSFDTMDYYQRKAIASAMGLNEQQLALMMRGNIGLISEPVKSAAELEELAIRQKEFATITDEMTQAFMAMAVSMRPLIELFKMTLNLIQFLAPGIQVAMFAYAGYTLAVKAASVAQALNNFYTTITSAKFLRLTTRAYAAGAAQSFFKGAVMATTMALRLMGIAANGALGVFGLLLGAALGLAYVFYTKAASPGFITILGLVTAGFFAMGIAATVFGFSLAPVLPFILAFAAAIMMVGLGIGIASAGLSLMVSSLGKFGTGLAESMTITALAIADIVESINELDTTKTVAIGAVMAAGVVAAPVAALASVGVAAVTRGLGGGDTAAGAGGDAGPAPVINVHLSVDGTEFATAVNKVEVEKYSGGGQSEMYSTIMDMISQGFVKGV